jgi:hypothetical protein
MQIFLSLFVLLLHHNCKRIAETHDIALPKWAQSWLEAFTILGLINFALQIILFDMFSSDSWFTPMLIVSAHFLIDNLFFICVKGNTN